MSRSAPVGFVPAALLGVIRGFAYLLMWTVAGFAQPANPPPPPEGVKVLRDLEYARAGERRLLLDLYLPENTEGPLPVIVSIHGGGWAAGSKERSPGIHFSARGYAVASVDYRLSGEAIFPAQLEDCKAAVRWLRANARTYNLDPKRFAAWGASAGGHLAALLGVTGEVKDLEGSLGNLEQPSRVQAVVDFYGPTDFLQMDAAAAHPGAPASRIRHDAPDSPESRLVGGPIQENKEKVLKANPITYITKDDSPFLIIHGNQDPLVPLHQSQLLYEALKAAGVEVTFHIFHRVNGAGHGLGGPEADRVVRMVEAFLGKHLKDQARGSAPAGRELRVPSGVRQERDIRYRQGASTRWVLDLTYPEGPATKLRPGLVLVHGGGWRFGDKGGFRQRALRYAENGYVVIAPHYRLSGEAPFPAAVEDVKCALRWLRAHARQYGLDPRRIGGYGTSAGAHLVAMLGLAGPEAGLEGDGPHRDQSSMLQAVVASATPTDFPSWPRDLNSWKAAVLEFLAGPPSSFMERARKASPITYVRADAPPFLVIHGTGDKNVPCDQAERFVEALRKAGAKDVEFLRYEGAGHAVFRERLSETEPATDKFFARTLWP